MLRIRDAITTCADTAVRALGVGLATRLDALRWIRSGACLNSWFLNGDILPWAISRAEGDGQVATLPSAADTCLHPPSNRTLHRGQISAATWFRASSTKNAGTRYRNTARIPEAILQLTGTGTRKCALLRLSAHRRSVPRLRQLAPQGQGPAIWQANRCLHTLCRQHPAARAWPYCKALLTKMGYQAFTWPPGSGILLRIKLEKPSL